MAGCRLSGESCGSSESAGLGAGSEGGNAWGFFRRDDRFSDRVLTRYEYSRLVFSPLHC